MITHHTGAIVMAKAETQSGKSADAISLANSITTIQTAQIAEVKKLLSTHRGRRGCTVGVVRTGFCRSCASVISSLIPLSPGGYPLGVCRTLVLQRSDGGVMRSSAGGRRGARAALLAVVALAALLLSMAAMHASMVNGHDPRQHGHASVSTVTAMPAAMATLVDAGASSDHAMGDMNLADCVLLGMVCFLTAAAMLLVAVVIGRLRVMLRPRAAAHAFLTVAGRLRPPEPPSLLVLSISRT
jgi:hypothetical protein